jgi:hypothetical protein
MTLEDHHSSLYRIGLRGIAPAEVRSGFDRARNVMLYALFDYDLSVVGEVQAIGAFELALKHQLNGHGGHSRGTLRNTSRSMDFVPLFKYRISDHSICSSSGLAHISNFLKLRQNI